jgi:hypothetical protein
MRKDFFQWSVADLERVLPMLLDNMRFQDINVQQSASQASATAVDRASIGQYQVELLLKFAMKWSEQSDGLTAIVSVEENQNEWTGCLCNRLADSIIGALKTACEIERGSDK